MSAIKAIVRNGRIEVDEPVDLPDGTELTIQVPEQNGRLGLRDEDWSDAPEAIEAWIRWYDSLEPLEFTDEERAAWQAARAEEKRLELAGWEQCSRNVERLFP